ncbi:MAG TPA: hypothetical protein VFM48_06930 [Aquabacterium sp.]|nr:hypothetical protein [Aquabacterium sp.]
MPCVDAKWKCLSVLAVAVLAGCASHSTDNTVPGKTTPSASSTGGAGGVVAAGGKLPAPAAPRNWEEARLQAARRMVAANPELTYLGKPPDMLLAIPVLSIELNADGSIRHIEVMRKPSQALDTIELAKQAVRKAAPFGDVSRLPKPWKFNETFLFNSQRKFKPMTLDQH